MLPKEEFHHPNKPTPTYETADRALEALTCDESIGQKKVLAAEIAEVIDAGYEVTVGRTWDQAYLRPAMIRRVYEDLKSKSERYAVHEKRLIERSLGSSSLPRLADIRKVRDREESSLERIRAEILFDKAKMPWHRVRGSALALQTISDAHDLKAVDSPFGSDGEYPTMSGRLPYYNGNFAFDFRDNSLGGLSLNEAIIQTRQRFFGEDLASAIEYAAHSLNDLEEFFAAQVTLEFQDIVTYCYDALGIRSRKEEVSSAILAHLDQVFEAEPNKESVNLLSVGCGTAQAILEVAEKVKLRGIKPHVILLDQDPIALAAAKNLAEQMGLINEVEIHCERLFEGTRPLDTTNIVKGRVIDVAEDTGLREYLPEKLYRNLTSVIWNHLAEGGLMSSGNMNINRPQPEFLDGLMGWRPHVIMRSIQKGFDLHEQSGIPKGKTRARVTRDGVYTLFFSRK